MLLPLDSSSSSSAPLGLVVFSPLYKWDTPEYARIASNVMEELWEAELAGFPIFHEHALLEHTVYYEHLYSRIARHKSPRSSHLLRELNYHLHHLHRLHSPGPDASIIYYHTLIDFALDLEPNGIDFMLLVGNPYAFLDPTEVTLLRRFLLLRSRLILLMLPDEDDRQDLRYEFRFSRYPGGLADLLSSIRYTYAQPKAKKRQVQSLPNEDLAPACHPQTEPPPMVARSRHLGRILRSFYPIRLPILPQYKFDPELKDVWLATAAPPTVARNSSFVARFSAYTQEHRDQVTSAIVVEAPETKIHLDLHTCQWEPGTKVSVALSADHLHVDGLPQSFVWNGKWALLRFDVSVPCVIATDKAILRFDVYIEGLPVAKLRPELKISDKSDTQVKRMGAKKAPRRAFASYASPDRRDVLGRIRSLQIFTGIDVFFDCLSLHPGEPWKTRIKQEISQRDIFWLFWSRHAQASTWVEWEWRTALAVRALDYIQPHPLEPPDVAPPPEELSSLQFGTLYESLLRQMKSNWWDRRMAQSRQCARRVLGSVWSLALRLLSIVFRFLNSFSSIVLALMLLGLVYFLWLR